MNFVELLAPARDLQSAVAAVDYGADAVYIGGAKFGARHAAGNSAEQIARVAEYAHRYGVRVHATLNTLIYDDELETAERQARELIAAGVDALIVQDMALRRMDLPVELHASTQVCNMTPEQARYAPRRTPKWSVSSTGPSAWVTAAAVFCRGRCPSGAATAAHAASRAA